MKRPNGTGETERKIFWAVGISVIIFLVIVLAGYVYSFFRPSYLIAKGYDIFRDLLLILLALAGAIGFLVWRVLRGTFERWGQDFEARINARVEEYYGSTKGSLNIQDGMRSYREGPESPKMLREAIKFTRAGLKEKLRPIEKLLALNNLAYFLAAYHALKRDQWIYKGEATTSIASVLQEAPTAASITPDDLAEFKETECFVKSRFAADFEEAKQVLQYIQQVRDSGDMKNFQTALEDSLTYLKKHFPSL